MDDAFVEVDCPGCGERLSTDRRDAHVDCDCGAAVVVTVTRIR